MGSQKQYWPADHDVSESRTRNLNAHSLLELANSETVRFNSTALFSGESRNWPVWRAILANAGSSAPATVQRTALRRAEPSTLTVNESASSNNKVYIGTYP